MKKIYLIALIPFVFSVFCFVIFNIIGSHVAPDGMLIEPFGLIPLGFLFFFISIIASIFLFLRFLFRKK